MSFNKSERPVSISSNSVHVSVPAKVAGYVYPQVPGTGDHLQNLAVQYVLCIEGVLEVVTRMTWHLEGLNSISHLDSHA